MTLAPLVRDDIRGVKGKPLELQRWCAAPGCLSLSQQRHHLWPKSYLRNQPYEWVSIGERTLPNSVGLCVRHHSDISSPVGGHKAHARYDERLGIFEWFEPEDGTWVSRGALRGQALVPPEPEVRRVRREEGLCPTCGHVTRKATTRLPPRKTKTWCCLVPDDAEAGTDVLDTYVQDLAVLMGLDPDSPRLLRYHVLVPVLEWVMQSKAEFVSDWEEAAA